MLITAARNEEDYIEKTIDSVIFQTIRPIKWIIVSDGSTDRTDEIVNNYATEYDFIKLLRLEPDNTRNFASQVYAQKAGIEKLKDIECEYIGLLDADVSFDKEYYEEILRKFQQDPKLGIAGGILFEPHKKGYVKQISSPWSVSGPIQMFRRQCYKEINYMPLEKGGQDAVAEAMARMKGWKVQSFPEIRALHLRCTGTATANSLLARYKDGLREYSYGNHPLYQLLKCSYRIIERPYILGSFLRLFGYVQSWLRKDKIQLPLDVFRHIRMEQKKRLVRFLKTWKMS
jgi:biofilm PGA synthesis N-glycosyltransferase PgaC